MIFYISDTHFGHENIIKFANRPFNSVAEMDAALVENWNKAVGPDDTVFHLGDFAWHGQEEIFPKLHGKKILILGNHDHKKTLALGWSSILNYYEHVDTTLTGQKLQVVLFHYPIYEWNNIYRKSVHLFGHVHGKPTKHAPMAFGQTPTALDVGVESIGYTPRTLSQLLTPNAIRPYTDEQSENDVGC